MFTIERQRAIQAMLEKERSITVKKLAAALYVSEATVRRDLRTMEEEGTLRRSHGGAVLLEQEAGEASFYVRKEENTAQKRTVATLALPYLVGNTFFLDSSSTVRALAAVWEAAHKTIITTGLETALLFSRKKDACVILPGGEMRYLAGSVYGAVTLRQLERFRADLLLCSCGGISADGEISEMSSEQGELKATMLHRAAKKILLFDQSKLGRVRPFCYASIADFDMLITDRQPPIEFCRLCERVGCTLFYSDKNADKP